MHSTLARLIDRLDSSTISKSGVIKWGCPVPSFGNVSTSRVATLGLNPSNREFVDEKGKELTGSFRRFHTLYSLGLTEWSEVDARHLRLILDTCIRYFDINPYDRWFRKLDEVISGTSASFYSKDNTACHLDLIPYATSQKWTSLSGIEKESLLDATKDTLGLLLRESAVRLLVLNGRAVVRQFEAAAGIELDHTEMPHWSLPRKSGVDVKGIAYTGTVNQVGGEPLGRDVIVMGFNHNLQSSFGVTNNVILEIRNWISDQAQKAA